MEDKKRTLPGGVIRNFKYTKTGKSTRFDLEGYRDITEDYDDDDVMSDPDKKAV